MTDSFEWEWAAVFLAERFDAWLLLNAKGVAILVVAAGAAAALARASATMRHLVWEGALLALLVLPAVGLFVPVWAVAVWRSPASRSVPPQSPLAAVAPGPAEFGAIAPLTHVLPESIAAEPGDSGNEIAASELEVDGLEKAATAVVPPVSELRRVEHGKIEHGPVEHGPVEHGPVVERMSRIDRQAGIAAKPVSSVPAVSARQAAGILILAVWAVGVVWLLARLAAALLALARLGAQSRRISGGRAFALFAQTARELGIGREVRLLAARDRSVPMAWGVFRPTVLIPEAFLAWPPERLRLILAHELVHVRRRDAFVDLAAQLAWALHWMNPLAWLAMSRLRLEREQACDDQVLELTSRPSLYAETLLSVAAGAHATRAAPHAALLMARPSQVEHRLRALLDDTRDRARLSRSKVVLGVVAAGTLVAVLGSLQPVARSVESAALAPIAAPLAAPAPDSPATEAAARDRAQAMAELAAGKLDLAEERLSRTVKTLADLVKKGPAEPALAWELGQAQIDLGQIFWKSGRLNAAAQAWDEWLPRQQELIRKHQLGEAQQRQLSESLAGVAERYAELALWEEAADHYQRAFDTYAILPIATKFGAVAVACGLEDRERLRRWTRDLFVRFSRSEGVGERLTLASALTMGPDAGIDPQRVSAFLEGLQDSDLQDSGRALAPVLAGAALNAGRFDELEQQTRKMTGLAHGMGMSPRGMGMMAIVEMQRGAKDRAKYYLERLRETLDEECRRALTLAPHVPVSAAWVDFPATHALYARARRAVDGDRNVRDPWLLLIQARNRAHAGLLARADRDLDAAFAQDPADPALWTARARIFMEIGRTDRAEQDFAEARRLAPNDPWPFLGQAHALLERGDLEAAEAAFAAAAARGTAAPLIRYWLDSFLEAGWWVAGPYPGAIEDPFAPEQATDISQPLEAVAWPDPLGTPRPVRWRRAIPSHPLGTSRQFGSVSLRESFPSRDAGSIYATTFVYSELDQEMFFNFGSRGPRRLWINGVLVKESNESFPTWYVLERFPIRLRKGLNRILVKVADARAPVSFFARMDDALVDRGLRSAGTLNFEETGQIMEAALQAPHGSFDWGIASRLAITKAAAGDWQGYRRWRDARWPDLEDGSYISAAYWMGHLFALSPTDLPADRAKWLQILEWGLTTPEVAPTFAQAVFALAHLRTGQAADALKIAAVEPGASYPVSLPVLALIHHELGNPGEARRHLERADRWLSETLEASLAAQNMTMPIPSQHWMPFVILRREAHAKILGREPETDATWRLVAARSRFRRGLIDRAAEDYEAAVRIRPDDADAWAKRAGFFADVGMLPRATADLDKAAELAKSAAEQLALARAAARGAEAATTANDVARRDECRARAMAALRRALEPGTIDRRTLAADPGLQPIRNLREFRALVQ